MKVMDVLKKEFRDRVKADLSIEDIEKELLENTSKQHYYLQLYTEARTYRSKLRSKLSEVEKELWHKYRNQDKVLAHNDIKNLYIPADEEYTKYKFPLDKLDDIIDYLDGVVKLFNQRGFNLKSLVELKKLQGY